LLLGQKRVLAVPRMNAYMKRRIVTDQNRKKIYISDLDGTLLRNDATMSNRSCATLNKLLSKGLLFTVASARSVITIREVINGVNLTLPIIELNGAFVSDMTSGKHLIVNHITPALLPRLSACIQECEAVPIIATYDGERDRLYYNRAHRAVNPGLDKVIASRKAANDLRLSQTDDLQLAFDDRVVCFTVIGYQHDLCALKKEVMEKYGAFVRTHLFKDIYSEFHWLTIQDGKASKDLAIKAIIKKLGIEDCEIVVFGDNDNDLPMFDIAKRSIAVENATGAVKRHATEVIGSNQKESVVAYIQNDFS
jgi:hypothetical protein